MKREVLPLFIAAVFAAVFAAGAAEPGPSDAIVFENEVARLTLGTNGIARSLLLKATGEEMLLTSSKVPFAALTHARPYAKTAQLTYPAQSREFPANRIERSGSLLKIGFADTRDFISVAVTVLPDRIEFAFRGFGIEDSKMDPKWTWRPEAVRFVQLPFAARTHFGEWMNVVWDERSAATLMGFSVETHVSSQQVDGGRVLSAGGEAAVGYDGLSAALVASETPRLLDGVARLEEDHDLPRGVEARRSVWARQSYFWARDINPENADAYIACAKAGGFPLLMLSYTSFAKTCGHYLWKDTYPNGLDDLKAVCEKVRAAGLVPGLHMHYSKVSRDDPYVVSENPDTRFNVQAFAALAQDIDARATEIPLQVRPVNWNDEDGRRVIQIDREWITFKGISSTAPWRLTGCTRGALGSVAAAHRVHETVRHIDVDNWVRFFRLDANSSIVDELADRLGALYRACGFRFAYFDGAEDVPQPYWYHVTRTQQRVWEKLSPAPIVAETYVRNHFGWHMFARGNAFDPYQPGQVKAAYARYQAPCMREARESFTTVDLGWANLKGKTVDDFAFLLARAREWQAPVALWTDLKDVEENPDSARILELFRDFNRRAR